MVYNDVKVKMPEKKVILRHYVNGVTYVYYTVKAYRNKEGKPTSDVVCIGKQDKESGMLIPNTRYYELFSDKVTIIGKAVSPNRTNNPRSVKSVGTMAILLTLARNTKLLDTLQQSFPSKYEQIFTTASYMLSEGNVMAYIEDWFDETKVESAKTMNDVAVSRLFASITEEERNTFFSEWIKCRSAEEHITYDVTSISSYSQSIDNVEFGYNRDGENLAQINFGMFYGMTSGLPVYYHDYNGSIPDVACFKYMMKSAKEIGINSTCFVFDNGFVSKDNFNFMQENNYSFITSFSNSRIEATS